MINDPLFPYQWQLHPSSPWNVRAFPVWPDYTGKGVTVFVADDGFQVDHPDLAANVVSHVDLATMTPDGRAQAERENHGTAVAGLIAAPINDLGVVGVAPDAGLVLGRMEFGDDVPEEAFLTQVTRAFSQAVNHDVMNNSWGFGPLEDTWFDNTLQQAFANLDTAAREGRGGLGTIIVFSAGNETLDDETDLPTMFNSNLKNFQNHPYTIAVANLAEDGSIYSGEGHSLPGANVLVAAPGEGTLTTDRLPPDGYIYDAAYTDFGGTSAASPVTAGIVALMLEANPDLGFRDVQEILAYSARETPFMQARTNGAGNWNLGGLTFSDAFGFGVVDALAAVRLAETWHKQSTAHNQLELQSDLTALAGRALGATLSHSFNVAENFSLEHVLLAVSMDVVSLEYLRIDLISPSGTRSTLISEALLETEDLIFELSSVQFLGEDAAGTWTLEITNTGPTGRINEIGFTALGCDAPKAHIITDAVLDITGPLVMDTEGYSFINTAPFTGETMINLITGETAFNNSIGIITNPAVIQRIATGDANDTIVVNSQDNIVMTGRGNDVIFSGFGNNSIYGGVGFDIVSYTHHAPDGIQISGNRYQAIVNGTDFSDELYDITLVLFGNNAVTMLAPPGGITTYGLDLGYYLEQNFDVKTAVEKGLVSVKDHYLQWGRFEGRDPHPLFNTSYYLEYNPDVAQAVRQGSVTAHDHYQNWGWLEGRDSSFFFSTRTYLDVYEDVALAGINPLDHYLMLGIDESRTAFLAS
ncbi:S8 family serine peptidase [Desulfonatronum thioautotrophicum]|uniref:S8 family serine peptidase n=1 Tax=Desulfonatronum thioautotrophicum TaxID=617001 RepID=UPI0005EB3B24|nr:S8 family serine peptidase [Desulfonatronum thioautotrophicum]